MASCCPADGGVDERSMRGDRQTQGANHRPPGRGQSGAQDRGMGSEHGLGGSSPARLDALEYTAKTKTTFHKYK